MYIYSVIYDICVNIVPHLFYNGARLTKRWAKTSTNQRIWVDTVIPSNRFIRKSPKVMGMLSGSSRACLWKHLVSQAGPARPLCSHAIHAVRLGLLEGHAKV